ncbi:DUF4838 domain-containing protein [Clostridium sp. chh4-2]|uniref:DUF4838 domain-containing protein n=1 Tax=Clostridium sp. chh4-2 TaxID=2067550 RepID=UPI001FA84A3F|nr:DUF4838 domain-containing protein [Clostridium sp. chh4-2]
MKLHIQYRTRNSKILEYSSRELASYLSRMMPEALITFNNESYEADFTICLAVSDLHHQYQMKPLPDPYLDDQYIIQTGPGGGTIAGSNERSVLLGVYQYLHLLGCRFLAPGRQYESAPLLTNIEDLYQSCQKTASLRHRGVCIEGANSLSNIIDFIDWLPKLGYNGFFLQFKLPYTFMARWYHHELNPLLKPEDFPVEKAEEYTKILQEEIKKRGLLLHQAGHGWTGEALGFPSSDWKSVKATLPAEKKQMAALLNGKRDFFHGIPINTNLCYSNPEVIRAFTEQVTNYVKERPDIDYLHVWLADEYNNVCECDACRKTTLPDQYICLLNQVDRQLSDMGIATKIVFLLYQELLWPPKHEYFHNPDRFVLMFAPISRTFESSYQIKDSYSDIPEYKRNQIILPINLDENMAYLKAWQKQFKGDSFVYDYPLGRAHYGDLGYHHISRVISEDIKQIEKMGLNGYVSCQELRSFFPNSLPNYVMGYTLFDTSCRFEDIRDEYFQAAYGSGWQCALQYLSLLSDLCSCDYFNGKGERKDEKIAANTKQLLDAVEHFLPERPADIPAQSPANLFWKQLDYHKDYSLRLGKALLLLSEGHTEKAQLCWNEFQQLICEKETEFQSCLDVYRITEVSSKYTGFHLESRLAATL